MAGERVADGVVVAAGQRAANEAVVAGEGWAAERGCGSCLRAGC